MDKYFDLLKGSVKGSSPKNPFEDLLGECRASAKEEAIDEKQLKEYFDPMDFVVNFDASYSKEAFEEDEGYEFEELWDVIGSLVGEAREVLVAVEAYAKKHNITRASGLPGEFPTFWLETSDAFDMASERDYKGLESVLQAVVKYGHPEEHLDESKVNEQEPEEDPETSRPEKPRPKLKKVPEEPDPDAHPEPPEEVKDADQPMEMRKEYLGKSEDVHYYFITTEGGEGIVDDFLITDQEGVKKYSAKAENIEVVEENISDFIIQAIRDVQIAQIERSIFMKYIYPKLIEKIPDDEEIIEEPEEAEKPKKEKPLAPEEEELTRESKKITDSISADPTDLDETMEILHGEWEHASIKSKADLVNLLKDMIEFARTVKESKTDEESKKITDSKLVEQKDEWYKAVAVVDAIASFLNKLAQVDSDKNLGKKLIDELKGYLEDMKKKVVGDASEKKKPPVCKKCNKAHWPFKKCDEDVGESIGRERYEVKKNSESGWDVWDTERDEVVETWKEEENAQGNADTMNEEDVSGWRKATSKKELKKMSGKKGTPNPKRFNNPKKYSEEEQWKRRKEDHAAIVGNESKLNETDVVALYREYRGNLEPYEAIYKVATELDFDPQDVLDQLRLKNVIHPNVKTIQDVKSKLMPESENLKEGHLIEMQVTDDEGNEFDVYLVHDEGDSEPEGVVDISISGRPFSFSSEFVSMWRDEEDKLSDEGLRELALDALSNLQSDEYSELVAKGAEQEVSDEEEVDVGKPVPEKPEEPVRNEEKPGEEKTTDDVDMSKGNIHKPLKYRPKKKVAPEMDTPETAAPEEEREYSNPFESKKSLITENGLKVGDKVVHLSDAPPSYQFSGVGKIIDIKPSDEGLVLHVKDKSGSIVQTHDNFVKLAKKNKSKSVEERVKLPFDSKDPEWAKAIDRVKKIYDHDSKKWPDLSPEKLENLVQNQSQNVPVWALPYVYKQIDIFPQEWKHIKEIVEGGEEIERELDILDQMSIGELRDAVGEEADRLPEKDDLIDAVMHNKFGDKYVKWVKRQVGLEKKNIEGENDMDEKKTPDSLRADAKKLDAEANKLRKEADALVGVERLEKLKKAKAEKEEKEKKAKKEGISPKSDDSPEKKIKKLSEEDDGINETDVVKGTKALKQLASTAAKESDYAKAAEYYTKLAEIEAMVPAEAESEAKKDDKPEKKEAPEKKEDKPEKKEDVEDSESVEEAKKKDADDKKVKVKKEKAKKDKKEKEEKAKKEKEAKAKKAKKESKIRVENSTDITESKGEALLHHLLD